MIPKQNPKSKIVINSVAILRPNKTHYEWPLFNTLKILEL